MEKKNMKKIKAGAAIFVVVAVTFLLGAGPSIIADTAPDVQTYQQAVQITLTATDNQGVASTHYKLIKDNGADPGYSLYSAPLIVSEQGSYVIWYYSVDIAGNQEVPKSASFIIDSSAPVTTITIEIYNPPAPPTS